MVKYSEIERLREERSPLNVIPQEGAQENNLNLDVDILITGGNRGGGKTFMLCFEPKYDSDNRGFNGVIFRKEKGDLDGAIKTSMEIFDKSDGIYLKSGQAWQFRNGGKLKFTYFDSSYEDFVKRFQGQQLPYIGIDEITQMPYDKFRYIITCNRNSHGIKNRIWGTCNPDPHSWVRRFIDWWIGEDGYPIEERDGVIRYCFFDGENPDDIYWGNSAQEVYDQCSNIIDKAYESAKLEGLDYGKEIFIKRVTFTRASLDQNKILLDSDPGYVASISTSEEARQVNLYGNWNYKPTTNDVIEIEDMEKLYNNAEQTSDQIRRVTCDVAFQGGDALVMWLWIGNHLEDVFTCALNARETVNIVKSKLEQWRVLQENFMYDLSGVGQIFKGFFPRAVPFNAQEAVDPEEKGLYAENKSKCAYFFSNNIKEGEYSINKSLLNKKMSGRNFTNRPLKSILNEERKIIRFVEGSTKGKELIKKDEMKKIIGRSPDYFESLLMIEKFKFKEIKENWVRPKGVYFL